MSKRKTPVLRFKGFHNDWEQRKLGDLAEIVRGASPRPIQNPKWFDDSSEIGWLRISDVTAQDGRIHRLEQHISVEGQEKTRVLTTPHLLLSIAATVGKPVINYISTGVHDGFLIFLKPRFELEFMFQWLENFRSSWPRYGQPGSQVNLNSGLVRKQTIYIPTREEQQKIAGFCEKLDNLITLHQRKLDLLKELKKGYLQKMFPKNGSKFPQLRFKGFTDPWEERKLRDLLNKNSEKNKNLSVINVESVSNKTGFTKQTDQFEDYSVASADLSNYYVIREKQFAYNPSRINVGSIAYKDLGDEISVVSPLYVSFSTKKILNDGFLWNWFKTASFDAQRQRLSAGGVRDTLSFNQLSEMNTMFPTYPEQQKIGSFFKQLDNTITLHQRKLEKLQELKKGYLQKMFC